MALDSGFPRRGRCSPARPLLYFNGTPRPERARRAKEAAARALAADPESFRGHLALGDYYTAVRRWTMPRPCANTRRDCSLAPNDVELLAVRRAERAQHGRWEAGPRHLAQAQALDPRSVTGGSALSYTLLRLRRYPEALAACDRALALDPANLQLLENKAMAYLAQGDLRRRDR